MSEGLWRNLPSPAARAQHEIEPRQLPKMLARVAILHLSNWSTDCLRQPEWDPENSYRCYSFQMFFVEESNFPTL